MAADKEESRLEVSSHAPLASRLDDSATASESTAHSILLRTNEINIKVVRQKLFTRNTSAAGVKIKLARK